MPKTGPTVTGLIWCITGYNLECIQYVLYSRLDRPELSSALQCKCSLKQLMNTIQYCSADTFAMADTRGRGQDGERGGGQPHPSKFLKAFE